jgi:hypothetical protein
MFKLHEHRTKSLHIWQARFQHSRAQACSVPYESSAPGGLAIEHVLVEEEPHHPKLSLKVCEQVEVC